MVKKIIFSLFAVCILSCSSTKDRGPLTKYERSIEKYRNNIHSEHLADESPFKTEEERAKFIGFKYFKTDEKYNIQANLEPFNVVDTIIMKTSSGKDRPFLKYGKITFGLNGNNHQLTLFKSVGDNAHFFLPFTDETSGDLSYGGGRYLDLDANHKLTNTNTLQIDFNKAYNPYCAYVDGYSCPIPPSENHVKTKLKAGVLYQKSVFSK